MLALIGPQPQPPEGFLGGLANSQISTLPLPPQRRQSVGIMEETRQPPPEPLAIYAPPSYPRESDPLRSHQEKGVKVASHSVNSLPPSNGSSEDLKNSTCTFARQ